MPRSPRQKEKLLALLDILFRSTDQDHPMPLTELIEALERQGISAERKSIYADLDTLRQRGWDIELDRRRGYYLAARPFELPELKLLVDAVQSSKFISEHKSRSLIKKLESLCSRYQAVSLQRQVFVSGRVKTMNEAVLYSIDAIHEAIGQNRQIAFRYFDYNVKKEKVFRHDGKVYQVSPVGLLRSDESYYLVARTQGETRHYRVDRMAQPRVTDQKREPGCGELDMAAYTRRHFGMFSGRERQVKLRCPNQLAHVMLDRFGLETILVPDGADHFTLTVEVAVSQQFYGWLFGLGPEVELLEPREVCQEWKHQLTLALEGCNS